MDKIERFLKLNKETGHKEFTVRLIPNIERESILGVRSPGLRRLAKELRKNDPTLAETFIRSLPHHYHEENMLHAFLLDGIKDVDEYLDELEKFLPYINNWAVCDSISNKVLRKHPERARACVDRWITSNETYTVRFAIGLLLSNFLDEEFLVEDLEKVAAVKSDEYYINMMIAWYYSFALIKQYDHTIPYLEQRRFENFVHRKTIQKAVESYRISDDRKAYLKSLR